MGELVTTSAALKHMSLNGAELTPVSLRIKPGTTPEDWMRIANRVTNVGHGYWWWIGDLAHFATHHFDKPDKFLEQLAEATTTGLKHIEMMARMSKGYAVRERVAGLSVRHHQILLSFPKVRRQQLLNMCLRKRISAREIYSRIIPREKRTTQVILKVPDKYIGTRKFQSDLKDFCQAWEIKNYRVYGTKRPDIAKARVPRGAAVLA